MGQFRIASIKVQNQSSVELLYSATPPINRFHFTFVQKYWQRKRSDEAIIWIANYINQPSSKYLIKALNKYHLQNNRLTKEAFKELDIMRQKIEGTFQILFAFQDKYFIYMCMKNAEGFALDQIMKVHTFTQSQTKFVICSIITILQHLHERGYAAVSLDPHTITFDTKQQVLRLIDLPDLNRLGEPVTMRSLGKAYLYSSPEAIEGFASEIESDYYSLGLIMYEMMTRKKPINLKTKYKQKEELLGHKIQITKSEIPEGWTPSAIDFLVKLLIKNPEYRLGRYGAMEVRQQSWIQSYDWNILSDKHRKKISLDQDRVQRSNYKDITYDQNKSEYDSPVFQAKFQGYNYSMI